jgi:hypothetical protein
MLSNQAPPPPLNDKNALAGWFKQYIQPGMDQLGHKINSVDGDKFNFSGWQGNFDVDYGEGAGGDRGRLSWQTTGADDATNAMYAPGGQVPTYQPAQQSAGVQAPAYMPAPTDDPMAKIQAEIAALMANQSTPMEQFLRARIRWTLLCVVPKSRAILHCGSVDARIART